MVVLLLCAIVRISYHERLINGAEKKKIFTHTFISLLYIYTHLEAASDGDNDHVAVELLYPERLDDMLVCSSRRYVKIISLSFLCTRNVTFVQSRRHYQSNLLN